MEEPKVEEKPKRTLNAEQVKKIVPVNDHSVMGRLRRYETRVDSVQGHVDDMDQTQLVLATLQRDHWTHMLKAPLFPPPSSECRGKGVMSIWCCLVGEGES